MLRRIVGQIASPVRWDLCLETMPDLGVTGILEMPPAGTLTGIAKRALKGVETFALKTPDQLDDARAFCEKHGEASAHGHHADLADGRLPRPRAPSTSPSEAVELDVLAAGAPIGDVASTRDRTSVVAAARRPGRRVARRGRRPGLPRPAAGPPAPGGSDLMATLADRPGRAARRDPRRRRLPPLAGRPERRGRRGDRLQRRVDPAALRHQAASLGRTRGDHADDGRRRRPARPWSAPASTPRQIDCVIVATVSHLLQTPAIATAIAHELGTDQAAAFDISAACAGFCHGVAMASDLVRAGSAGHVLVIGVERLSDITDLHDRGTAFIFADGAGAAVVGPSETPGIGPVVWGSDGEQYDLIRQREDWRDVDRLRRPRCRTWPCRATRSSAGRPSPWPRSASRRSTAPGITVDDLDVLRPPPGQHAHHRRDGALDEAARHVRSPATSPSRATPRPPRSRSPSTG